MNKSLLRNLAAKLADELSQSDSNEPDSKRFDLFPPKSNKSQEQGAASEDERVDHTFYMFNPIETELNVWGRGRNPALDNLFRISSTTQGFTITTSFNNRTFYYYGTVNFNSTTVSDFRHSKLNLLNYLNDQHNLFPDVILISHNQMAIHFSLTGSAEVSLAPLRIGVAVGVFLPVDMPPSG